MTSSADPNANDILSAMRRIWGSDIWSMARGFAYKRDVFGRTEEWRSASPAHIARTMSAAGWTADKFVRALY